MAINLKGKKNIGNKSPILLSALVLIVSLIVSGVICNQTSIVEDMAEEAYFKSETFMETLADLTVYLKQTKLEDKPLHYHKYENLYNLVYYVEGWKDGRRQVFSNAEVQSEDVESRKSTSKFYMGITFSDAKNYSVEDSLGFASFGHEDFSRNVFQKNLDTMIRKGIVGREKEVSGYEQLRIYYFVPKGTSSQRDFVATNVDKYKATASLKVILAIHMLVVAVYVLGVAVGCYRNVLQGKGWNRLRNINLEIKLIGLGVILFEIRTLYWHFVQPRALVRIVEGDRVTQLSWIGIYIVGGVLGLCLIGWYMVEFCYCVRNGIVKTIKEESYLFAHWKVIRSKARKLREWIYRLIGIDLKGVFYLKLMCWNGLHIVALVMLARITWSVGMGEGWLVGISVIFIGSLVLIGFMLDLNHMKKRIIGIKGKKELERGTLSNGWGILILLGYSVGIGAIVIVGYDSDGIGMALAIALGVAVLVGSIEWVKAYCQLYEYIADINGGKIGIKPTRSFLSPIIEALDVIDEGLQSAVHKELVSQRMKTELISNVSHDLKTPLTSIINYVDLLKDKELSEETQQAYVEILDRKSKRLKILIEDLFEASKTASGNVELTKEKINLIALLNQTLGEMAEKIGASTLQFKVNLPDEKVMCELDGRRTYRIFENLIGNILKYSAPSSRVYIECSVDEEVTLSFKNISECEMNFTAEEIIERFKRGDESRHREGSGLGLAIAKNLTELQGGRFEVYIDGDLFKVVTTFKRAES